MFFSLFSLMLENRGCEAWSCATWLPWLTKPALPWAVQQNTALWKQKIEVRSEWEHALYLNRDSVVYPRRPAIHIQTPQLIQNIGKFLIYNWPVEKSGRRNKKQWETLANTRTPELLLTTVPGCIQPTEKHRKKHKDATESVQQTVSINTSNSTEKKP